MNFVKIRRVLCYSANNVFSAGLRPELSGALFAERSGAKKRERKAEKAPK